MRKGKLLEEIFLTAFAPSEKIYLNSEYPNSLSLGSPKVEPETEACLQEQWGRRRGVGHCYGSLAVGAVLGPPLWTSAGAAFFCLCCGSRIFPQSHHPYLWNVACVSSHPVTVPEKRRPGPSRLCLQELNKGTRGEACMRPQRWLLEPHWAPYRNP